MITPELTTYVIGNKSSVGLLDLNINIFTVGNKEYSLSPYTGKWNVNDVPFTGMESVLHLINFLSKDWHEAITELKSDLSYNGLILEVCFDPKKYTTEVSSYVSDLPLLEANHYYTLDPNTFMPKIIIIELLTESKSLGNIYNDYYFFIKSINEITEIPAPKEVQPLLAK